MVSWFGGVRYPKGIPAGLVAIAVGMIIAWGSNLFGLNYGGLSVKGITDAFTNFGFSVPLPAVDHIFSGFEYLGVILITAIPFGIYDLVEAMDNVESAEAAGDAYPTTRVLTADGVISLIGCLMGNPFINAVYIGHPGWKAMGGRIGYSAATGIMVIILSWFGVISLLLAIIPVVAISPILLYIGMLIGAQAFQSTPKTHAPAIVLALTPHLAAWCKTLIDGALGAAGTSAAAIGMDKLGNVGVLYEGLKRDGRRRHLEWTGACRDRRLRRREEVRGSLSLRVGGRAPDLLRLHARRIGRHRGDAGGGDRLRDRGDLPLRAEPRSGKFAGQDRAARGDTGRGAGGMIR